MSFPPPTYGQQQQGPTTTTAITTIARKPVPGSALLLRHNFVSEAENESRVSLDVTFIGTLSKTVFDAILAALHYLRERIPKLADALPNLRFENNTFVFSTACEGSFHSLILLEGIVMPLIRCGYEESSGYGGNLEMFRGSNVFVHPSPQLEYTPVSHVPVTNAIIDASACAWGSLSMGAGGVFRFATETTSSIFGVGWSPVRNKASSRVFTV